MSDKLYVKKKNNDKIVVVCIFETTKHDLFREQLLILSDDVRIE